MPDRPQLGEEVEVRKAHGGGFLARVTSVARLTVGTERGTVHRVVAVLDAGGPRFSGSVSYDPPAKRWFALERDLESLSPSSEAH